MAKITKPKFEVQEYVLERDRELPEAEQSPFQLYPLSVNDATQCKDLGSQRNAASALRFAASRGIVGWKNLDGLVFQGRKYPQDKDGKLRPRPEEIDVLYAADFGALIDELGAEVIRISGLEESEKNS